MTTQTIVGTPTLPRVNLLPPEIGEARVLRQYRLAAGGAVLLAVVAVGGVYWHAHGAVADAQSALDASTAKQAQLTAQETKLQGVTALKNQVAAAQTTLTTALSPQILWSRYLQDLSVTLGGNVWFNSMTLVSQSAAPVNATTGTSPFTDSTALGTATFVGKAVTHNDVAKLMAALDREKGISHATFTSSAKDATPIVGDTTLVTFTVQASIDATGKPTIAAKPPTTPAGN